MNEPIIILCMTDQDIEMNPFIDKEGHSAFYNYIEEKLFGGKENVETIDCTKICVARNIQDSWFNATSSPSDLAMLLLSVGPKADDSLPNNCVSIQVNACSVKKDTPFTMLLKPV